MENIFRPTAQLKISITPNCNNECPICLNKTTRSRNNQVHKMSVSRIKELIDEANSLGMVGTYWTGGEPMTEYENLLHLMEYSTNKNLMPTLVTNGGLIAAYGKYKELNREILQNTSLYNKTSKEIVRSLKKAGLQRVYFSIDCSHTTLESADSNAYKSVPTDVAAKAINTFLEEGYGHKHKLESIGYRLRITSTSSGILKNTTDEIVKNVLKKCNLNHKKNLSDAINIYNNSYGEILLKNIYVSTLGDAANINSNKLDSRKGKELFDIKCPHFRPTEKAYDNGNYHGDLYIDYTGIVYTCGNHAYPIGNIYKESLTSIINGVNTARLEDDFGYNRKVYKSLLMLSKEKNIGENAIGKAFELINKKYPELISGLQTQCGSCSQLGHQKELQEAFLDVIKEI